MFETILSSWHHGVVVITTTELHSTKPWLRFCTGSNPACGMSEICDGKDLWQWSRLEIRLHAFRRSTIPQKQLIIIIIIIKKGINSFLCMNKVKQKINVSLCISKGLSTWIWIMLWHFTPWQNWLYYSNTLSSDGPIYLIMLK